MFVIIKKQGDIMTVKLNKSEELNMKYGNLICEEYSKSEVLIKDLASKYECSGYMITKVLELNGVKKKNINEVNKQVNKRGRFNQRKYTLDYDYFNRWTSNMAYILGFIYADGYITEKTHYLRLNIQRKDRHLLELFKSELNFTGNIVDYIVESGDKRYESSRLIIGSMDIVESLRTHGLHHNKSLTIKFPKVPKEYELDFIRGFFDGDGSVECRRQIHKTKNSDTYQLRLRFFSGSLEFLNSINSILSTYGLKYKNVNTSNKLHNITYSTKESYLLYDLLYKENSLCLHRKKSKFEDGFRLRNDKH